MDLLQYQAKLRERRLKQSLDDKSQLNETRKELAARSELQMPIIDFRYRPNTKSIIGGIAESPIFRAGLIANGVDIDEFYSRARTMPEIIADLKQHNVLKAVIVGRDAETTYGFKPNNEEIRGFVESCPEIFQGYFGVDPHKGIGAIRDLDRALKSGLFHGAAMDPMYARLKASDAKCYPVYAKCCEMEVPIVITAGPARYTADTVMDHTHPKEIDVVAKDFPELKVIVSHGAWPFIDEMIGVAFRNRNVYLEISEYEQFPGSGAYLEAANGILKDRMLFASACPFVPYLEAAGQYQTFGFDQETLERIMYKNAAELLGIGVQ